MGFIVPAKARVGRSGNRHVLYIIDETDNEFLKEHLGKKVIVHIREIGISVRVSLTLNKTFRTPRVMMYLPTACDPTWAKYYDRMFTILIEVKEEETQLISQSQTSTRTGSTRIHVNAN